MVPLSQRTDYYVASTIPWSQANVHTDKTESQGHLHKDYSYLNHTKIIWGLLLYVNPPIPRKHTKKLQEMSGAIFTRAISPLVFYNEHYLQTALN